MEKHCEKSLIAAVLKVQRGKMLSLNSAGGMGKLVWLAFQNEPTSFWSSRVLKTMSPTQPLPEGQVHVLGGRTANSWFQMHLFSVYYGAGWGNTSYCRQRGISFSRDRPESSTAMWLTKWQGANRLPFLQMFFVQLEGQGISKVWSFLFFFPF